MVKIVFNLSVEMGVMLHKLGFIDCMLLTPDNYKKRALFDFPCFFETDFKDASLTPENLVKLQEQYARSGDIFIAPDHREHKQETIDRMKEYFKYKTCNNEVVVTPQGRHFEEWKGCLQEIKGYSSYIGVPFILDVSMGPRYIELAIKEVQKLGYKYHLLGINPCVQKHEKSWFLEAESFDSKANIYNIKVAHTLYFIDEDGNWVSKRAWDLGFKKIDFNVRLIMYYEQLRYFTQTTVDTNIKTSKLNEF